MRDVFVRKAGILRAGPCVARPCTGTVCKVTDKNLPMSLTAWALGTSSIGLTLTKSPIIALGLSVLCLSVLLLSRISGIYSLSCDRCLGSNRKVKRHYQQPSVKESAETLRSTSPKVTLGWAITYISTTVCGACGGKETATQECFISRNLAPSLPEAQLYATDNRKLLLKESGQK